MINVPPAVTEVHSTRVFTSFLFFFSAGMVSESQSQMEEKGEHKERSGSTSSQRPPHHLQRGANGPRGDRPERAGQAGEEETKAGATAVKVPEQAPVWGFISHPGIGQRQRGVACDRQ